MNLDFEFYENGSEIPAQFEEDSADVSPEFADLQFLKGKDGKTPVKGVDYFTPAEVSEFKEDVTPEKGKDYFTASEVAAIVNAVKAGIVIPAKTSDLQNDSGFLTSHQDISGKQDKIADLEIIRSGASLGATALQSFTEQDPTVPSWAKQTNKPTYTAEEVGALPDTTALFSGDYNDLKNKPEISGLDAETKEKINQNTSARHTHSNKGVLDGITSEKVSSWDSKLSAETDPTVPSWAKAETKPSYTASEVHAISDDTSADIIFAFTSELTEDDFSSGYYSYTAGSTLPTTKTSSSNYYSKVIECNEGDKFVVTLSGGRAPKAFAFCDSERNVLLVSEDNKTYTNAEIVAPEGTSFVQLCGQVANDMNVVFTKYEKHSLNEMLTSIPSDSHINDLIDSKLVVIENGNY